MKITYLLKRDFDETGRRICERHQKTNEVIVVAVRQKSAKELLDLIESSDKVIMW